MGATAEMTCKFATEKINLPRGKVFQAASYESSPDKRENDYYFKLLKEASAVEPSFVEKRDYYREYWKLYLQNESLVADIESAAHSNLKMLKKNYNLEDYYEHHLGPQLITYPHKFINRLKQ